MASIRRWFERREKVAPPKVKPCPRCGYYCNNKSVFCIPPMTEKEEEENDKQWAERQGFHSKEEEEKFYSEHSNS